MQAPLQMNLLPLRSGDDRVKQENHGQAQSHDGYNNASEGEVAALLRGIAIDLAQAKDGKHEAEHGEDDGSAAGNRDEAANESRDGHGVSPARDWRSTVNGLRKSLRLGRP